MTARYEEGTVDASITPRGIHVEEDGATIGDIQNDAVIIGKEGRYIAKAEQFRFDVTDEKKPSIEIYDWDREIYIKKDLNVDAPVDEPVNMLREWLETRANKGNMEMVNPTLEEKLPGDVAKEIGKYGGKKKRKTRKLRKSKRRTTRRRSSTRKV